MKKLLLLFLAFSILSACKNESNVEKSESTSINDSTIEGDSNAKEKKGLKTMVGQFIYYGDAAVLQTRNDIYGVIINDKMHELNEMAKEYKTEPTDYVTVQVRGHLIPKPEGEEGWPFRVDIKTIDNVKAYKVKDNEVIKLGNDATE